MYRAYIALGALRAPNRPATAPIDVERSLSGSRNAVFSAWQSAQPWPAGVDSDVSANTSAPSRAGVGRSDEQPATAQAAPAASASAAIRTGSGSRLAGLRDQRDREQIVHRRH